MNQVPQKLISSIAFLKSSQFGLSMNLLNTPCQGFVVQMMKILRTILWKNALNWLTWFSEFSSFWQPTLDMGVFISFMRSPDCEDFKNSTEEVNFWGTWFTPLFKKNEMDKTLGNGLSMSDTDPLNHKWLDFTISLGLALHQFQNKLLLITEEILKLFQRGDI